MPNITLGRLKFHEICVANMAGCHNFYCGGSPRNESQEHSQDIQYLYWWLCWCIPIPYISQQTVSLYSLVMTAPYSPPWEQERTQRHKPEWHLFLHELYFHSSESNCTMPMTQMEQSREYVLFSQIQISLDLNSLSSKNPTGTSVYTAHADAHAKSRDRPWTLRLA